MALSKEDIQLCLQETESRFNAAKIRKDQAQAALEEAEIECHRVQGEYRVWQKLLADFEADESQGGFPVMDSMPEVKVVAEPVKKEAKHG